MLKFLTAAACLCALLQARATAAPSGLQEDDIRRSVSISSPAISPNGRRAVALVSRIDWNEDKRRTNIVLFDLPSGAQRILTFDREGLSSPAFSPDGTRVAFIAASGQGENARAQVFVMPLDGGDARPVTSAKDGVEQFAWRPDGKAIAYTAADPKPQRKGADRFRDSFIFTTEPITDREPPRPVHLFLASDAGGKAQQLTFGTQSVAAGEGESTLSWMHDGKTIAFTQAPNTILNDESYSRVMLLNVATRNLAPLTAHTSWETNALVSPDGKHIAYLYSGGDNQVNLAQLYVTSPAAGAGMALSAQFNRPVYTAAWLPDSSGLLFIAPDATSQALVHAELSGRLARVDLGDNTITSSLDGAIARDGSIVFVCETAHQAPGLCYRSKSSATRRLTSYNATISSAATAAAQTVTFPTSTGVTADAVLYTPPGFTLARKYPLVIYIHGGPTSSSTRSFDFYAQVMAARGWLVLRPNYRGSDNLGIIYQRAVLYDPEEGPGKDIMAAVDAVRSRGIVDDRRIAVSGWSYGGIMTAWMISKYHIWAAAVSGASVNDWITDYGVADDSLADRDLFHGSPFTAGNAAEWRRASAIWYAKDVTTPVLILSDIGDNRDPFATSSMYWRALRDNHKDATLRVWPVNGHFPRDPVRAADVYHYWIGFIAQHFR